MIFTGFPNEGITFLDEILINNSKEWFESNKERHQKLIVTPNKTFVQEMGEHLQILIPTIHAIPKVNKSLFRIYRDARFHLAEPIKTRIGIIFWQGDGHRMQSSSFYMHYDSQEVFIASGIRNFKPALLSTYREYIQDESKRILLHTILQDLKEKGYSIPEPHYKRYPLGFEASQTHSYLSLYNAMFAYSSFKPTKIFYSSQIVDTCFTIYKDMFDLHQWVYELTLKSKN